MRAFFGLSALISQDLAQVQRLVDFDQVIDDSGDTAVAFQSGTYALAASESAFEVPFGGVTNASLVIVVAADEIELQVDSNAAPLVPVRPTPAFPPSSILSKFQAAAQPGLVLWRGKITSLFATNPSSTAVARFTVFIVGEAE